MIFSQTGLTWEIQTALPVPAWMLAMGFVLSIIVVVETLRRETLDRSQRIRLAAIRVAIVAILFVMCAGWKISYFVTELPELILLVDTSDSMTLPAGDATSDGRFSRMEALKELLGGKHRVVENLGKRYQLKAYAVGEATRTLDQPATQIPALQAQDRQSRLGSSLVETANRQRGRSPAAVVLLSDGVVTHGTSLRQASKILADIGLPVWCVGFGNEADAAGVSIEDVTVDDVAFVGEKLRVRIALQLTGSDKQPLTIKVRDRDTDAVLKTQSFDRPSLNVTSNVDVFIPLDRAGEWNLEAIVDPVPGETRIDDNSYPFKTFVRDDEIDVLLIAQQPSYEFRFLKHLLERTVAESNGSKSLINLTSVLQEGDPRYAAQDRTASALPPLSRDELDDLDVVVLCDADTKQLGKLFLARIDKLIRDQGVGMVYVVGPNNLLDQQTDSPLETLLPCAPTALTAPRPPSTTPLAMHTTMFGEQTDALQLDSGASWSNVPPLYWVARTTGLRDGVQTLLEIRQEQAGGKPLPVVVTHRAGAGEVWMQLTDESFRWRVDSRNTHEKYWLQLIRRLAKRKRSDRRTGFQLATHAFTAGDPVEIALHFAEALDTDEVGVTIFNENEERRETALLRSDDPHIYRGSISDLEPGNYRVELDDRGVAAVPPSPARFGVQTDSMEMAATGADFAEMADLCDRTSGIFARWQNAATALRELPAGRQIKLRQLPSQSIWNHWMVATLVVILLTIDWYLRRRWGLP